MNILVLGASGLIGSAMYRVLSSYETFNVWGTMRNRNYINMFDRINFINYDGPYIKIIQRGGKKNKTRKYKK